MHAACANAAPHPLASRPAPHTPPRIPSFRLGRAHPCPPPTSGSSVARGRAPRSSLLAMARAGVREAAPRRRRRRCRRRLRRRRHRRHHRRPRCRRRTTPTTTTPTTTLEPWSAKPNAANLARRRRSDARSSVPLRMMNFPRAPWSSQGPFSPRSLCHPTIICVGQHELKIGYERKDDRRSS